MVQKTEIAISAVNIKYKKEILAGNYNINARRSSIYKPQATTHVAIAIRIIT